MQGVEYSEKVDRGCSSVGPARGGPSSNKNVKHIAWIPENSETTGKHTQKTLKGMYQVKVLRQSGATDIVNVRTDWVEKNFIKAALGAVQRAKSSISSTGVNGRRGC